MARIITQEQALTVLDMLRTGALDMVTCGDYDWLYNPHMGGGEWEVFDHDGDHTTYRAYGDIYEASEVMIG